MNNCKLETWNPSAIKCHFIPCCFFFIFVWLNLCFAIEFSSGWMSPSIDRCQWSRTMTKMWSLQLFYEFLLFMVISISFLTALRRMSSRHLRFDGQKFNFLSAREKTHRRWHELRRVVSDAIFSLVMSQNFVDKRCDEKENSAITRILLFREHAWTQ